VTAEVLRAVYAQLAQHRVLLEGTLLKPNMVVPGADATDAVDDDIARATVDVLRAAVPAAVPGIVFLSGGMSEAQATSRLNAINLLAPQPWELSFSFGRALQAPVLRAWAGDDANRDAAQAVLRHRAVLNGAARHGSYRPEMEEPPA
jgi:fructose-bisphosphate aldolase class I